MTVQEINQAIEPKRKGTIFTFEVKRPAKVRKSSELMINIEKLSIMQGMVGTQYANRKPVREAVANGVRPEVELPSHIEETFTEGATLFWRGRNGKVYLPVCLTGNKPKTTWLANGEKVDLESIKEHLLASEYAKKRPSQQELEEKGQAPFASIDVDHIIAIH
jgi:membrane carboxypeptidase/penicillin-binding protein PbpC